ncbi:SIS domain-containing protein [Kosmotoga sp. DU53]|uniref:SIS domain-containing protein n=1 Tax=Kosmotoga sp. DU53 TaxID=1310160 RepID=UPI0007C4C750|nr:SIS domain-containing protein [Kosmotoga sp. DU53]OAA22543.1 hypothetical protein DU53_03925 [Kosmotoga sp. DU53]
MFEQYYKVIDNTLRVILEHEAKKMKELSRRIYSTLKAEGLVYAFGTGHSHMLVEELFYRAGGLVPIYPVLVSSLMLHEGAVRSSRLERLEGYGEVIADSLNLTSNDLVLVFSNSGVNAVPVEFAITSKNKGSYVAAITSFDHTNTMVSRNKYNKKLLEVVDLAIDNHVPYGDTSLDLSGSRVAPLSSITGMFILNAVTAEVAKLFVENGETPPVFVSANSKNGEQVNQKLIKKYSDLVQFL